MNHTIPLVAALIWMRGSGDVTSPLRRGVSGNAALQPEINQHPLNSAFLFLKMLTSVHFAPSRPSVADPVQRHTQTSQSLELGMVYKHNNKSYLSEIYVSAQAPVLTFRAHIERETQTRQVEPSTFRIVRLITNR